MDYINEFLELNSTEFDQIFRILKKYIPFKYGCIYYTNPKRLIYSEGKSGKNLCKMSEILRYKTTEFGFIELYSNEFSNEEKKLFKTCTLIISNIIKNNEISKIMKLQTSELQDGYLKLKKAEDVKSQFISHISHELRTPLNSIIGFSDLLGNEFVGKLNKKQKEYVKDIKISGLNLLSMVNEILDMSKIESGVININPRKFETKDLLYETINIIKPLILDKNIKLIENIENFTINTDYRKIEQILLNILSNAIKYTNDKIKISVSKQKDKAVFIIEDNGIGIDKKYHKKIFEKFVQLEDKSNSTGLGLTITKEFVRMLNGNISLSSSPKNGAKFIVKIPSLSQDNVANLLLL